MPSGFGVKFPTAPRFYQFNKKKKNPSVIRSQAEPLSSKRVDQPKRQRNRQAILCGHILIAASISKNYSIN